MKNTLTVRGGVVAVFLAAYLLLNGGRVDEVNFLGIKIKGPEASTELPGPDAPRDMTQEQELERLRIERLKLERELAALKKQDTQLEQLAAEAPAQGGEVKDEWLEALDGRSDYMEQLLRELAAYNEQAGQYDPSLIIDAPQYVNFCCDLYGNRRCQLVAPVVSDSPCFCLFQGTGTAC